MKKRAFLFLGCILIFTTSCGLEQKGRVEIHNKSNSTVTNITLTYSASGGDKKLIIDALETKEQKNFELPIAPVTGNTFVANVLFQYSINDTLFDIWNDKDVTISDTGEPYNNGALLCENRKLVITIFEDHYSMTE